MQNIYNLTDTKIKTARPVAVESFLHSVRTASAVEWHVFGTELLFWNGLRVWFATRIWADPRKSNIQTGMQTWLVCIIMFDGLYQFRNFDQFCRCLLYTIPTIPCGWEVLTRLLGTVRPSEAAHILPLEKKQRSKGPTEVGCWMLRGEE